MSSVIKIKNISKKYIIKHQAAPTSFREAVTESIKKNVRRVLHPISSKNHFNATREEFWALKDIDFEVKQGERLGIIGRNGAGKSTLLKLLSRITVPTTGRITIRGKVASLLEVGTGFHPELTGRENIFLNGVILGMTKAEIKKKFDAIVAFSEVEKFLDTPVKRYSSGMYVRLAFAVAAHLEPEILIIDEVLAVGDVAFQKKCLGKMKDVSEGEGRTVLFVSHNMNAIEQLCNRVLFLEHGQIKTIGNDVRSVIKDYVFDGDTDSLRSQWENTGKEYDNPYFKPLKFSICSKKGAALSMPVKNDHDIFLKVEGEIKELSPILEIFFTIYDEDGKQLFVSGLKDLSDDKWVTLKKGLNIFRCKLPSHLLNEGTYRIELYSALFQQMYLFQNGKDCPSVFLMIKGGLSDSPYWVKKRGGYFAPIINWELIE